MRDFIIYSIGFSAQLLFGSRMLIQWIQSEKEKKVVSSHLFWKTSLIASTLLLIYGLLRHDAVIIIGQLISYFIYIRNLQIMRQWQNFSLAVRTCFTALPFVVLLLLITSPLFSVHFFIEHNTFKNAFLFVGFAGQFLLNARFIYQLYIAEKMHDAILPLGFWVISLLGSLLVITYAIFRRDPVLLVAQIFGIVVYYRNIVIEKRSRKISV